MKMIVSPNCARRFELALVAGVAVLAGCGGDPQVTPEEGAAFGERVRVEVPALASIVAEDLDNLANSICDSVDGGQSYGNVSETVAAYTGLGVAGSEVDSIIRIAVETACPEFADDI